MKPRVLLSWSSGKDCAWALHVLRQNAEVDVVGLVTTYDEASNRVAMHGVRMELVEAQAAAAGIPLWPIPLPWPCSNEIYEQRFRAVIQRAENEEISQFAFGDLFLADVRNYREQMFRNTSVEPTFPIWGTEDDTSRLAQAMIHEGFRSILTCVDLKKLPETDSGRELDEKLLADLPDSVDRCGERGEFHTFCYAGPIFERPIGFRIGDERIEREGFLFTDLIATK